MRLAMIQAAVLGLLVAVQAPATDPEVGAWRADLAKSVYSPADLAPRSAFVTIEPVEDGIKVIVDLINAAGQPVKYDYIVKFDGRDYPVQGDPNRDATAGRKVDAYTLEQVSKKNGTIVATNRIVVARDGQSRTQTTDGVDARGRRIHNVVFWERR